MASVKTLTDDAGEVRGYLVRYRSSAGRARSKTFPKGKKGAANEFAVKVEADKITGLELDPRGARICVADYVAEWQAVQAHAPASALRVAAALKPFTAAFGELPLAKVRQSHIKAWQRERLEAVKPRTVRIERGWVRAVFSAAVADRLIGFSPCVGVALEGVERRRMVIPSPEQIGGLCEAVAVRCGHWAAMVELCARTGLRPGEAMALRVGEVDFLRLSITVARSKTPAGRRTIPVDEAVVDLLAAHLSAYPAGPDGLIFHRPDGRPLSHRGVDRVLALRGWRLHDMRHFYASEMLAAGLSLAEVAALLGHSSPVITAAIYAHVPADGAARARTAAAGLFGPRHIRVMKATSGRAT